MTDGGGRVTLCFSEIENWTSHLSAVIVIPKLGLTLIWFQFLQGVQNRAPPADELQSVRAASKKHLEPSWGSLLRISKFLTPKSEQLYLFFLQVAPISTRCTVATAQAPVPEAGGWKMSAHQVRIKVILGYLVVLMGHLQTILVAPTARSAPWPKIVQLSASPSKERGCSSGGAQLRKMFST